MMTMTRPTTFLEYVRRQGTPLVDSDKVTFVWQGQQEPVLLADSGGLGHFFPARSV